MGEEHVPSEQQEPVANDIAKVEKKDEVNEKTEAVTDEKGDKHGGVTEMEEDKSNEGKVEAQQMDVDNEELKDTKEIEKKADEEKVAQVGKIKGEEDTEAEKERQDTAGEDRGKAELKSEEMDEETEEKTKKDTEEKAEDEADGVKEEDENLEKPNVSKKRPRLQTSGGEKDSSNRKEPVEKEKEQKAPSSVENKTEEPKTSLEKKTKEPETSVEKKEKEPKTPVASTMERPVRERKSVERLVATIEKDSAKDFHIEKGRGTALKDIPNVAYKLSRKKNEDTFKLLHTIIFGRRGKAAQVKNNISRFSGFVWHDNEEKQMTKLKEKLDKCVKEKLVDICDVLAVPISKANPRKEDIIAKLLEFLVEPHATSPDLLAGKEQGKKRKRVINSASESTPSKGSAKSRKKADSESRKSGDSKSIPPESEDESEEEKEEDANGPPERSDDEMSEKAESVKGSESEQESDEQEEKQKRGSAKSYAKKGSSEKPKTKKVTITKKTIPQPKKAPARSPLRLSKGDDNTSEKKSSDKKKDEPFTKKSSDKEDKPITKKPADKNDEPIRKKSADKKKEEPITKKSSDKKKEEPITKKSSDKKKEEPITKKTSDKKKEEPTKKSSTPKKSSTAKKPSSKDGTGKVLKVKDKPKEETPNPSADDLRNSICKILKEVDFNTATFTDILKLLCKQFSTDLTHRKFTIKLMIQEELSKLADAEDTDGEEDGDGAEKDEKNLSSVGVKA